MKAKMPIFWSIGLLYLSTAVAACAATDPARWVPARWDGGPLEIARRTGDQAFPDNAAREAAAKWLSPATLELLSGTPLNCLLVTFSGAAEPTILKQQHGLVKDFARLARDRGTAVLGIIYPGSDPAGVAQASKDAGLDGVVLDGDFPAAFTAELESSLRASGSAALVIPIARDPSPWRMRNTAIIAVQGVPPGARNLADSGIRAGASAEPWIDSNVWLVRSFRLGPTWRPVWINAQPSKSASATDYVRSVADAAVGGGVGLYPWMTIFGSNCSVGTPKRWRYGVAWRHTSNSLRITQNGAVWRHTEISESS